MSTETSQLRVYFPRDVASLPVDRSCARDAVLREGATLARRGGIGVGLSPVFLPGNRASGFEGPGKDLVRVLRK